MFKAISILITSISFLFSDFSYSNTTNYIYNKKELIHLVEKAKIPGLSIAMIVDTSTYFLNYGYADIKNNRKATSETIYELASCSKSYTALAILKLEHENLLNCNDPVDKYIPWFKAFYEKRPAKITIKNLLYHTSGISWKTLAFIGADTSSSALENAIRKLSGIKLKSSPGVKFQYATINYDILGLIIEKISYKTYEEYMMENIFKPLKLKSIYVNTNLSDLKKAKGYKISWFRPREYIAPIFRGNNPAGYINSDIKDMVRWLKIQMGFVNTPFDSLIELSHLRDLTVPPNKTNLNSYAMGWHVSLNGDNIIWHDGVNPNYTSYVGFCKDKKTGIVILANSNSDNTRLIGEHILKNLVGAESTLNKESANKNDKMFSILLIISTIILLSTLFYFITIIIGILNGQRKRQKISIKNAVRICFSLILLIPLLFAIYIIPNAVAEFNWKLLLVWSSSSLIYFALIFTAFIVLSVFAYILSSIYVLENVYKNSAPYLITLSLFSGFSNMFIIIFITSAINNDPELKYTLFYFILVLLIYIGGRKVVQTRLIKFTMDIIYDLRIKLINKVFSSYYQDFEKIEKGRIYSTLNDDTVRMGDAANVFVAIITSIITILGGFIFLATLAFWATLITIGVVVTISIIYFAASRSTAPDFEKARDTQNVFMKLVNGMTEGFKELTLHKRKKDLFQEDVENITDIYRQKLTDARVKFVNAFLLGESLLIIILATVAYVFPHIFPDIEKYIIMNFVIILLYLIGPFNLILNSIPNLMQIKISWNRINQFLKEIPEYKQVYTSDKIDNIPVRIQNINVHNLMFSYTVDSDQSQFTVGPIDFELIEGEILFIIGGNGSGKTTFLKLLTGLYTYYNGEIKINDKKINPDKLGEYFSVIFNPHYLFEKLYDIDWKNKNKEINAYIDILNLKDKVDIVDGHYSSLNLSTGQRKRLALLQSFLESKPVYIFDEWAADQDPEYKKIFYENLLLNMKKEGKIVIAITHDDNYYHVADKILKLERGKVVYFNTNSEKDYI